jgi:EF hand
MNQRTQPTRTTRGTWNPAFAAALAVTAAAWALPALSTEPAKNTAPSTRMQAGPAAAPQAAAPTAAGKSDAAAAFKRADANGDGKLSKEGTASLPAIAARFDDFDKDKDGFLSMDEFMAATAAPN